MPTADAGLKSVWAGIRRRNGVAPRKVRAARTKVINTLVEPLGSRLIDVRDRALILIGFAGALRRGELVALDVEDIDEDADGLGLTIRRSKTDQEAEGGPPYGSPPRGVPGKGVAGVGRCIGHRRRPPLSGRLIDMDGCDQPASAIEPSPT
jgi:integrase